MNDSIAFVTSTDVAIFPIHFIFSSYLRNEFQSRELIRHCHFLSKIKKHHTRYATALFLFLRTNKLELVFLEKRKTRTES